jgi:hypothetical protein
MFHFTAYKQVWDTFFKLHEQNPCRKLTLHKPEGTQVDTPAIRWLASVEEHFKTMGIRNWR